MDTLITIAFVYSIGFISLLLISSFIAGYNGAALSRDDLWEALLWPLTIVMLIGTISQAIISKIFKKG